MKKLDVKLFNREKKLRVKLQNAIFTELCLYIFELAPFTIGHDHKCIKKLSHQSGGTLETKKTNQGILISLSWRNIYTLY